MKLFTSVRLITPNSSYVIKVFQDKNGYDKEVDNRPSNVKIVAKIAQLNVNQIAIPDIIIPTGYLPEHNATIQKKADGKPFAHYNVDLNLHISNDSIKKAYSDLGKYIGNLDAIISSRYKNTILYHPDPHGDNVFYAEAYPAGAEAAYGSIKGNYVDYERFYILAASLRLCSISPKVSGPPNYLFKTSLSSLVPWFLNLEFMLIYLLNHS